MARGSTDLDNREYDNWLTKNGKQRELRQRHADRKAANKGYEGYHFGIGEKPVYTKDKAEFKKELDKRGLMMRDDVKTKLRGPRIRRKNEEREHINLS